VIFDFLRDYVIERHGGEETWKALLKANGYGYKIFFPVTEYRDEELVALAKSAAEALHTPLPAVLEDFGAYVGNKLMTFYHMYTRDEQWKTFDVIENAGGCIHNAIHKHNSMRKPPKLSAHRETDDLLVLRYQSHRKMCDVVKGVIRGLGERYGESFHIEETCCMHDGARECIINVYRIH
jgi:predicted hydrocarbon binding protein